MRNNCVTCKHLDYDYSGDITTSHACKNMQCEHCNFFIVEQFNKVHPEVGSNCKHYEADEELKRLDAQIRRLKGE